jgi:benzoate-CoA ligase
VKHYRPDFMFSVPTVYRNLLRDHCTETDAFDSVRCFISAGEKLPESLFERWRAATGKPILEGIGATETIFLTIANTPTAYRAGATGRPQPGVGIRLLDEHDEPITEPGRPGMLWVKIGSLCSGYWNQPEKTRDSFRDGWYRTGDAFSFDADGWWYHLGRGDELLKISGQWVSPVEIEECALATPGVADAAVVGVPNSDGLVRLAMFVVPAGPAPVDGLASRLQDKIKSRLSIYKCPRNITFVDEIPRTATGKVQRFRLRELAAGTA